MTVPWLIERAGATLATWFLGHEAGNAIADVVTGRFSPSGRLPVSWPRAPGQVPIFYGQRPSGRPADPPGHYTRKYLDLPLTPLFPFGHGLSYGRFAYSDLKVTPARAGPNDTIEVAVTVTNEGEAAAEETVFLFVRDMVASVARPLLELKAFTKIELSPGARATVVILLPVNALCFPGRDWQPVLEPGAFELLVGPCADRTRLLSTTVTVAGDRAVGRRRAFADAMSQLSRRDFLLSAGAFAVPCPRLRRRRETHASSSSSCAAGSTGLRLFRRSATRPIRR